MTFLKIRQRIAELMGMSSVDRTPDDNATMEDKLKEWVNSRYKLICGKESWNWMVKDSIVQTVPDITTGTVSVTEDSTSLVFSSAPSTSVEGYFIQFAGTGDWYEIDTHTAASTSAEMTVPYLGTTDSAMTYVLRKVYYLLPSDTGKILNISQHRVWNTTLIYVPTRLLDRYSAIRQSSDRPRFYSIVGVNEDRQYKMEIYPSPNVKMNLNVRRYQVIEDMVNDDDVPVIPESYHEILVWDVLSTWGYLFLDDTRVSTAKAEYNNMYKDMKRNHVDTEDIAVRQEYDVDLTADQLGRLNLPVQP